MYKIRMQAVWVTTSVLLGLLTGAGEPHAAEPFYKGKRLSVLINFAAGGPTDIEGRLFAKYLAKHIDGQPGVIVQNIDGAGGIVGASYLGEVAPRDGTVLGYLSGTSWTYVNNPERWRVDFRSYEFVAYQPGTTVHFARTDIPPGLRDPSDIAKARGVIAGGLSADTSKDLRLRLGLDMLGVPYQYVTGYRSSPPARLALQRGEINMFSESPPSYRSVVEPGLVRTGEAIPIFYDSVDANAPTPKQIEGLMIPSYPQLFFQIKGQAPSGQMWEAYRTIFDVNATLQRLIALPPGTPMAAIQAVRAGIEKINNDKEFAAEAIRAIEFAPDYEAGPNMSRRVREILVASPQVRNFVASYIKNPPKK
jgi:tripartite-type tricarboxylate transporter receptor subunit TctC